MAKIHPKYPRGATGKPKGRQNEQNHDKKYSHDKVLSDVLTEIGQMDAEFHLLPELSDIDTFQDLKDSDIEFEFVDPEDEG